MAKSLLYMVFSENVFAKKRFLVPFLQEESSRKLGQVGKALKS